MKHSTVLEDIHPLDLEVFQDTELRYIKDLLAADFYYLKVFLTLKLVELFIPQLKLKSSRHRL